MLWRKEVGVAPTWRIYNTPVAVTDLSSGVQAIGQGSARNSSSGISCGRWKVITLSWSKHPSRTYVVIAILFSDTQLFSIVFSILAGHLPATIGVARRTNISKLTSSVS